MAFEANLQGDLDDAGIRDRQQIGGALQPHAFDKPARCLADGF